MPTKSPRSTAKPSPKAAPAAKAAKPPVPPPPAGGPPRLYLITGSDAAAIRGHARELVAKICGGNPADDPGVELISADREGVRPHQALAAVFAALEEPPFFGSRKIIWIRQFDFAAAKKDKRGEELLDHLEKRLGQALPADLVLILEGPGLDGRSRLMKVCKAAGEVVVLSRPDPHDRNFADQIRAVVDDHCHAQGMRLDMAAHAYLLETVGSDPGRLRGELDKLFAYVLPAKEVTLADCRAVCSHTPEAAAWAFADALAKRDLAGAFAALDILIESRTEPIAVMGGVTSRFQQMLQVRAAAPALRLAPGCSYQQFKAVVESPPPQVKAELGETFLLTAHPYRAWIILDQSASYSDADLRAAFVHLVETSRQLVSGAMDRRLALEQLAVDLCRR